ncbi:MAG: hypothetical protein H6897_06840 [Rhodobacteraceae bacterium]|nr:hypothetical protein [uncultured Defluviimonas sp.]MCC0069630.1 hypothetical protein [Paracoccaceae bacterium]
MISRTNNGRGMVFGSGNGACEHAPYGFIAGQCRQTTIERFARFGVSCPCWTAWRGRMRWKIEEYDGHRLLGSYLVPGNLGRTGLNRILCQLAARHLNPKEVIAANLRKGMRGKTNLLEVKDDNGGLQVGENPFLTARKVDE